MNALLLVDCGNSAIKSQWVLMNTRQSSRGHDGWRAGDLVSCANSEVTVEALLSQWRHAADSLGGLTGREIEISWLSVGPVAAGDCVASAFQAFAGKPPRQRVHSESFWQGHSLQGPHRTIRMSNGYAQPQQLGADRWISAVGALAMGLLAPSEAGESRHLIVSAGTATTVDLIGLAREEPSGPCEAKFLGGWIWPGLGLMAQSLQSGTRDLQYELDRAVLSRQLGPATDSRTAISLGVTLAQAAPLIRLLEEIQPETMLLHGGAADFLGDAMIQLGATMRPVPVHDLSLRGLQAVSA